MADAAFRILVEPPGRRPGRHFADDDVLRAAGAASFRAYNVDPDVVEPVSDFFIRDEASVPEYTRIPEYESSPDASSPDDAVVLVVGDAERDARRGVSSARFFADSSDAPNAACASRSSRTRAVGTGTIESRPSCARRSARTTTSRTSRTSGRRWYVQIADLSDAKTIPDVVSNVVDRFYAVDAVVDLLCPPKPETRDARLEGLSSASFDDVFDAGVRASFRRREVLPHVAKSEGPRRFVSLCPPPRVSRRRSGSGVGAAIGLARAVRGLHVAGEAAEFAALDPPVGVFGVWSDAFDERSVETSEMDDEENASAKAIDALAKATLALLARDDGDAPNANASASGSFFAGRRRRGVRDDRVRRRAEEGFADVAEEVADWVVVDAVWL